MHDYLFGPELVRLAFVTGIAVSLLLYERRHITTGSIVVPGYIGLFIFMPLTVAATFANALLTYWLVNRVLRKRVVLYGRDKFAAQAVISIAIQTLLLTVSPGAPWLWESDVPLLVGVGYVIPALVAHDMARQGVGRTVMAVLGSGLTVAALVAAALFLVPGARATGALAGFDAIAFDPGWIPLAVLLSAAAAWGMLKNHSLRAGGFIGVAYLAALAGDPTQIVFVACVAVAAWWLVTRTLSRTMILFGRRKFGAMLAVSAILSWTVLWMGSALFGIEVQAYQNLASIALMPIFIPGLLANDMERAGPGRVAVGSLLGVAFVLPAILFLEGVVNDATVHRPLAVLACMAGLVVFDGQWRPWLATRLGGYARFLSSGRHTRDIGDALARWRGRHLRPRSAEAP